jgi:hypothetical protein
MKLRAYQQRGLERLLALFLGAFYLHTCCLGSDLRGVKGATVAPESNEEMTAPPARLGKAIQEEPDVLGTSAEPGGESGYVVNRWEYLLIGILLGRWAGFFAYRMCMYAVAVGLDDPSSCEIYPSSEETKK